MKNHDFLMFSFHILFWNRPRRPKGWKSCLSQCDVPTAKNDRSSNLIQWHGRDVRDTEAEFAKSCSFVVLLLRTISSFYLIEDAPLILEFGKIQLLYGFVALLFTEWSQNRLNLTVAAILPPCMLHLAFASFGPCVPAICSSSKHISSSSAHFTRL